MTIFPRRAARAAALAALLAAGCEYDVPPNVYPGKAGPDPVITAVEPDSAGDGIILLRIRGRNFDPAPDRTFVYFGKAEAAVLSVSDTSISVRRPLQASDTVTVRVVVRDAFAPAVHGPYRMEPGLVSLGDFGWVFAMTVDAAGSLYLATERKVLRVAPEGTVSEYGRLSYRVATGLRMLRDGNLLVQREDSRFLYRIPPGGGEAAEWLSHRRKVSFFDLDAEGRIVAGGAGNGLFLTLPDGSSSTEIGDYQGLDIRAVRVSGGSVTVAVEDPARGGLWRNALPEPGGTAAGPSESVFPWSGAGDWSGSRILDFALSADGDLLVATDREQDPVLRVGPDGAAEPLYPGALSAPASHVLWGIGNYLFIDHSTQSGGGLVRVIAGEPGGTAYMP